MSAHLALIVVLLAVASQVQEGEVLQEVVGIVILILQYRQGLGLMHTHHPRRTYPGILIYCEFVIFLHQCLTATLNYHF